MTKSRKLSETYKIILALDPSGSFYEGKGTTGWCVLDASSMKFITCGSIFAKHYVSAEEYWDEILKLIREVSDNYPGQVIVVCEDYLLYATKLKDQINSRMETPKLIGVIQHYCYIKHIPYYMQTAAEVKKRWTDEILMFKKYIKPYRKGYRPTTGITDTYTHHSLDAIRHAVHYATFKNKR